jgi:hypothetical protein
LTGQHGRILFTTNPLYGHRYPMLPLIYACAAGWPKIIVGTGPDFAGEHRQITF